VARVSSAELLVALRGDTAPYHLTVAPLTIMIVAVAVLLKVSLCWYCMRLRRYTSPDPCSPCSSVSMRSSTAGQVGAVEPGATPRRGEDVAVGSSQPSGTDSYAVPPQLSRHVQGGRLVCGDLW
jgi:hypothetical protein